MSNQAGILVEAAHAAGIAGTLTAAVLPMQVVRSAVWSESGAVVTGGEDARLALWSAQPVANGEQHKPVQKAGRRSAGAVARKDSAAARHRQSPY